MRRNPDLASEEVVDAGGVGQDEREADDRDDQEDRERVVGRGRVGRRQVVGGIGRGDQQVRVHPGADRDRPAAR